jgi:hypothetical protein
MPKSRAEIEATLNELLLMRRATVSIRGMSAIFNRPRALIAAQDFLPEIEAFGSPVCITTPALAELPFGRTSSFDILSSSSHLIA